MAGTTLTVTVRIDGLRETLDAFQHLPRDASNELRDRSVELAETIAEKARAAGKAEGRQAALVATTVRPARDRVPAVQAGGARRLGRHRAPAYGLLFGSEFGMNRRSGWYAAPQYEGTGRYSQYKPHRGQRGYWFFPTVEGEQDRINREWNQAADAVVRRFSEGG